MPAPNGIAHHYLNYKSPASPIILDTAIESFPLISPRYLPFQQSHCPLLQRKYKPYIASQCLKTIKITRLVGIGKSG